MNRLSLVTLDARLAHLRSLFGCKAFPGTPFATGKVHGPHRRP